MTSRALDDHRRLFDLDPEAIACPYPAFARLREEMPVCFVEETGVYVVTRYQDVMRIVRDPVTFSSVMPTGPHAVEELGRQLAAIRADRPDLVEMMDHAALGGRVPVLLRADPPDHTRQRNLVARAFSPPRVKQLEESIRAICNELIDRFVDRGRVELVREFAVPLPLTVIARALGVPDGDLATFKRWSDDFVVLVGNHKPPRERIEEYVKSRYEFGMYFGQKIVERRRHPQDDLISDVVTAVLDDGTTLSDDEMLGMFSQFLVAGNETTTKHIAATMWLLCTHPDQMARVRADQSLITNLVEESLRMETPVQGLYRTATVDTEVGGVPIPKGAHLMVMYASGNRDEAQYESSDEFDVGRANAKTHLAFSQGPHFCLGASLARSESRIAFECLLDRLDDLALAPENRFEMEATYVLHGFKELHVTFRPNTGRMETR